MRVCDECAEKGAAEETHATIKLTVEFGDDRYVGGENFRYDETLELCPKHAVNFLNKVPAGPGFVTSIRHWIGQKLPAKESESYNEQFNLAASSTATNED